MAIFNSPIFWKYVLTKSTRDGKKIDINAKIKICIWLALERLNFDWLDLEKLLTLYFSKYLGN